MLKLNITPAAAARIARLVDEENRKAAKPVVGLRLSVKKGGCAGFQYEMALGAATDSDHQVSAHGATVLVDPSSAGYLQGATLNFTDELMQKRLVVENPNTLIECGCGSSYSFASPA